MPTSNFLAAHSLYIENLMRHAFLFELSRHLLLLDPPRMMTILNAEVDDAGVDVVLNSGTTTRHVQMKTLNKRHAPNPYAIAESLFDLPGGCVIWMCYDASTLRPAKYHMLGQPGNQKIGVMELKPAKRRKNGEWVTRERYVGVKSRQANHQDLSIEQLASVLFAGELARMD